MVLDEQNVSATVSTPAVAKALASSSKTSAPQASSSGAGTTTYSVKLPELGEGVSEGELIKMACEGGRYNQT